MYDTGGDGWQGAWFGLHELNKDKDWAVGTVANGTLEDGYEGFAWICLANGRVKVVVWPVLFVVR